MTDINKHVDLSRVGRYDSTESRLAANIEAMSGYVSSPRAREFYRHMRRHEANPFNALFFDREAITEAEIGRRVARTAAFFDLPVPEMTRRSEILAEIVFAPDRTVPADIRYDLDALERIGINNPDAFETLLTHELSHQFLAGRRYGSGHDQDWCKELGCDFLAGARCFADGMASGKYRYAVSRMRATDTHPDGRIRFLAVKAGFDYCTRLADRGQRLTAENCMSGFAHFILSHSDLIDNAYREFLETPSRPPVRPKPVEEYSDTNLIKQFILKSKPENGTD